MPGTYARLPRGLYGLSAKLLALTAIFVMLAEVLIFLPTVARFRVDWMKDHISAAHLAILSLEATPDHMVSDELKNELLRHAGVQAIVISKPPVRRMLAADDLPDAPFAAYDLRDEDWIGWIVDAVRVLLGAEEATMRVIGLSPQDRSSTLEVLLDTDQLRAAMLAYAGRIVGLSILISLIAGALVYFTLQWLIVRPLRRLTGSIITFRAAPTDPTRAIPASTRRDEIGVMQRSLGAMEGAVRSALRQQMRLAALGSAVAKINHDLRNILTTAQLVSDRLADSSDPKIRQMAPTAVSAIDRAVRLCTQTLEYARSDMPAPVRADFALAVLVDDVGDAVTSQAVHSARWENRVPPELVLQADRDQLFRVLANLGRNAIEAGATRVSVSATLSTAGAASIEVADDGPGLPPKAREKLFLPFVGSARPGGTGLGLAIARELVQAHGGTLGLVRSSAQGTVFRIELPGAHRLEQVRAAE